MARPQDLPDYIDALKAMILASEAKIGHLEDLLVSRDAAFAARGAEIEYLKLTIAKLRKLAFGRKSEKIDHQLEQLELRLDDLLADEAASPVELDATVEGPRSKPARQPLSAHLPRETHTYMPEAEACTACTACTACGAAMTYLGEDV